MGPSIAHKGRGATLNMAGRFESRDVDRFDDGWDQTDNEAQRLKRPKTIIHIEHARSIISKNDSPDIRFNQSVNPYRGCEHGCIYCYARPSHAFVNLSPGIDFETQLFVKRNAAALLRNEISKKNYVPSPINFGANTDPYQPIEREEKITRACLKVMLETNHPITIVTKNALITRDIDIDPYSGAARWRTRVALARRARARASRCERMRTRRPDHSVYQRRIHRARAGGCKGARRSRRELHHRAAALRGERLV
jgi:hypothetical protein